MAQAVTGLNPLVHQMYPSPMVFPPTRSLQMIDLEKMHELIMREPFQPPQPLYVSQATYETWKSYMEEMKPAKNDFAPERTLPPLPPQMTSDLRQVMEGGLTVQSFLARRTETERAMFLSQGLQQLKARQIRWTTRNWGAGSSESLLQPVLLQVNKLAQNFIATVKTADEVLTVIQNVFQTEWMKMISAQHWAKAWKQPIVTSSQLGTGDAEIELPMILKPKTVAMSEPGWQKRTGPNLKPLATPSNLQCLLLRKERLTLEQVSNALKQLTPDDVFDLLPSHLDFVSASHRRKDRLKDALEAGERVRRDQEQRQREFRRRYKRAGWFVE